MQPLSLRLVGFRGIRDGLGCDSIALDFQKLAGDAQLIALKGQNGRGKTTLLDNLTPYLVMPSRAGADGLGSFSYYDHVYLPESSKDLIWTHGGQRYRAQVIFRLNGRRRTEAYLLVEHAGRWQPVRLPDGTVSDGKVETYQRCVEAILGSAETFFTSVFSAQGRRQLSTYRNAEIKTLLADLLGLDEIRALGERAGATVRQLRTGLTTLRQELAALQQEAEGGAQERARLGEVATLAVVAEAARGGAQAQLDQAKAALAKLAAEQEMAAATEARRRQLGDERAATLAAGKRALEACEAQDRREVERLQQLEQRAARRAKERAAARTALLRQQREQTVILQAAPQIAHALRRLPLAERLVIAREQQVEARRQAVTRCNALKAEGAQVQTRLTAIEREAGQAALRAQELRRRLGLTANVPCAGTDLPGRCPLLSDAHEAQQLLPSAEVHLVRLDAERAELRGQLDRLQEALADCGNCHSAQVAAERRSQRARTRLAAYAARAARQGELAQARQAWARLASELAALPDDDSDVADHEDRAAREAIVEARAALAQHRQAERAHYQAALARIDAALATLPPLLDLAVLDRATRSVTVAQEALQAAEADYLQAIRQQQIAADCDRRQQALQERIGAGRARIARVEQALGLWTLFAKCLSNDGVIALAIDDAGPQLAALANDLLLACYGPRFTVSIRTLVETAKGEAREGFDILVHDAEADQSKSVSLMSGGERTWINECLTRAIALYLAQDSGRCYQTLFADETDGALDPEHKRMFMAMKREVLRLGGYQREFFITQTPELAAMADAVIDLDVLAGDGAAEPAPPIAGQAVSADV